MDRGRPLLVYGIGAVLAILGVTFLLVGPVTTTVDVNGDERHAYRHLGGLFAATGEPMSRDLDIGLSVVHLAVAALFMMHWRAGYLGLLGLLVAYAAGTVFFLGVGVVLFMMDGGSVLLGATMGHAALDLVLVLVAFVVTSTRWVRDVFWPPPVTS